MTQEDEDGNYYFLRALWFIPWAILLGAILCWVQCTWLDYRKSKYGQITDGRVTKCYTTTHETGNESYRTDYHVEYTFDDRRDEITRKVTIDLVQAFVRRKTDVYVPINIVRLCVEYLGTPFVFWYGPYTGQFLVSENIFSKYTVGSSIKLWYDPSYPYNVQTIEREEEAQSNCSCRWHLCRCVCFLGLVASLTFGLIATVEMDHRFVGVVLLIFLPAVLCAVVVIICNCSNDKLFCFGLKTSMLQIDVVNVMDDLSTAYS